MRSLTVKLSAAFVLIGLIGAILVAVLVGLRTRSEFNRFLSTRDQEVLISALGQYYAEHTTWTNVDKMLAATPPLNFYSRNVILTDPNGVVVFADGGDPGTFEQRAISAGSAIRVNNHIVGHILFREYPATPPIGKGTGTPPPAKDFIDRVTWASAMSATAAGVIALILGVLLARTLTKPLHELTAATRAMASGQLGTRVRVHAADEIGMLATSFNQMSTDLAHASHIRKQMTADVAHDLRTPLSILRGYTEGLQDGRIQGSDAIYALMHGEVEHLQRLVEDLRILSLADAGELTLSRRMVDPAALLERTGLAYIVQAEQQGIALRVEAPAALPSISVDTDQMTRVLNNLVSNALRHTQTGEIVLSAKATATEVILSIRDTGSGISAEDLPHIFDRFYRADSSRQRSQHTGSGLGLAIAKAIVDAHGDTLMVASTLGVGTTFTLVLGIRG